MFKITVISILLSFLTSAHAEPVQYSNYTCDFERGPDGSWFLFLEEFALYSTDLGFNQVHVSSQGVMGYADTDYFAGACTGLMNEGDHPSLVIQWFDGNNLGMSYGLGCAFTGDSVKISTERKAWNGNDEYFSSSHVFKNKDRSRTIETFLVVGMKSGIGVDEQKCIETFKKEFGDVRIHAKEKSSLKFLRRQTLN